MTKFFLKPTKVLITVCSTHSSRVGQETLLPIFEDKATSTCHLQWGPRTGIQAALFGLSPEHQGPTAAQHFIAFSVATEHLSPNNMVLGQSRKKLVIGDL